MKATTEDRPLNELVRTLDEKLRRYFDTIVQLQSEVQQKNELLSKKTQLEALGEVGAMVAHEIRSPLGAIELYAGVLSRGVNPEQRQVVEKIRGCVGDLNRMVADMLTFTGRIVLERQVGSLDQIVERALELSQEKIRAKSILVARRYEPDCVAEVDPLRLQQVFVNLVQNAVDAMNTGGRLTVTVSSKGCEAAVRFKDMGRGFAPDDLVRLGSPFFTTKVGGTGLGLCVAVRIVEAHGGAIDFANDEAGGACVTVRIPRV